MNQRARSKRGWLESSPTARGKKRGKERTATFARKERATWRGEENVVRPCKKAQECITWSSHKYLSSGEGEGNVNREERGEESHRARTVAG